MPAWCGSSKFDLPRLFGWDSKPEEIDMSEIRKSVIIDATAAELFAIVDDPTNFPKYVPNVTGVEDVTSSKGRIGDTFRVIYKVLGVSFDEKFTTSEYEHAKRVTSAFKGGMTGTFRWEFEPHGEQCKVSVQIDYEVAGGVLGKAADLMMLERANAKSIEGMLENLRRMVVKPVAPAYRETTAK
jgi:ribosome-associated toxin RatA of RatAB toxin-antitoxin module